MVILGVCWLWYCVVFVAILGSCDLLVIRIDAFRCLMVGWIFRCVCFDCLLFGTLFEGFGALAGYDYCLDVFDYYCVRCLIC